MKIHKIGLTLTLMLYLPMCLPVLAAQACNANLSLSTPDSRFTDNGETVTDLNTGLIWAKCAEGLSDSDCTTGTALTFNWQTALNRSADSTFTSKTDWRLPNIKELVSIVELACHSPSINTSFFPNTPGSIFWSSTPDGSYIDSAWVVDFKPGAAYIASRSDSSTGNRIHYVRLVSGGQ